MRKYPIKIRACLLVFVFFIQLSLTPCSVDGAYHVIGESREVQDVLLSNSSGGSDDISVSEDKSQSLEEQEELTDELKKCAESVVGQILDARRLSAQDDEMLSDFVFLGYALEYIDSSNSLEDVERSLGELDFESKDRTVRLEMQNTGSYSVAIDRELIERRVLDVLQKSIEPNRFLPSKDVNGFYVKVTSDSFLLDLEKSLSKLLVPEIEEVSVVSKDQLLDGVVGIFSMAIDRNKSLEMHGLFWVVFCFIDFTGEYDVYLQCVSVKKSENKIGFDFVLEQFLERSYVPPGFVRLSRIRAEGFWESIFYQAKEPPYVINTYVNETGEGEFLFRLASPPSRGSHREAYLEEFSREITKRIIETSKIN